MLYCGAPKQDASCRHLYCSEDTRRRFLPISQVTKARPALKAADAALTAAKTKCEAVRERRRELAAELTLAQSALQGGSLRFFLPQASSCLRQGHGLVTLAPEARGTVAGS